MGTPEQIDAMEGRLRPEFQSVISACKDSWAPPADALARHNVAWNNVKLVLGLRISDGGRLSVESAEIAYAMFPDDRMEACLVREATRVAVALPTTRAGPDGALTSTAPIPDGAYRYEYRLRMLKK